MLKYRKLHRSPARLLVQGRFRASHGLPDLHYRSSPNVTNLFTDPVVPVRPRYRSGHVTGCRRRRSGIAGRDADHGYPVYTECWTGLERVKDPYCVCVICSTIRHAPHSAPPPAIGEEHEANNTLVRPGIRVCRVHVGCMVCNLGRDCLV
jgi:hypothetical protein